MVLLITFISLWRKILAYSFATELALWIERQNISRKELIALLQCSYYEEFDGLDLITLSRWLTGKSIPPLYKQLYIAKCLDIDFIGIIESIDASKQKCSKKSLAAVNFLTKALDFSISIFSYQKLPEQVIAEIKDLSFDEYFDVLGNFYNNISSLKTFNDKLFKISRDLIYTAIFLKNDNDVIVGHWSGIIDMDFINDSSFGLKIPEEEISKSLLIMPGYYVSSKHYFELLNLAICYYLLKYSNKKEYAYFFIVDFQPMVSFCKIVFDAEEVKYYRDSNKMGVYLLKFNIIKAISNPIILKDVQERLKCLFNSDNQCHLCNRCNLAKFKS